MLLHQSIKLPRWKLWAFTHIQLHEIHDQNFNVTHRIEKELNCFMKHKTVTFLMNKLLNETFSDSIEAWNYDESFKYALFIWMI